MKYSLLLQSISCSFGRLPSFFFVNEKQVMPSERKFVLLNTIKDIKRLLKEMKERNVASQKSVTINLHKETAADSSDDDIVDQTATDKNKLNIVRRLELIVKEMNNTTGSKKQFYNGKTAYTRRNKQSKKQANKQSNKQSARKKESSVNELSSKKIENVAERFGGFHVYI